MLAKADDGGVMRKIDNDKGDVDEGGDQDDGEDRLSCCRGRCLVDQDLRRQ